MAALVSAHCRASNATLQPSPAGPSCATALTFAAAAGAQAAVLKENFKFDVSAYVQSTVRAYDVAGTLVYSRKLKVNDYRDIPTSNYQTVVIRSSNGIAYFSISGYANGNTVIDNVVAVTRAAPTGE